MVTWEEEKRPVCLMGIKHTTKPQISEVNFAMSRRKSKGKSCRTLTQAAVKRKRKKKSAKVNRRLAKIVDLVTDGVFDEVADTRKRRGKRFSVASLLMALIVGAVLLARS